MRSLLLEELGMFHQRPQGSSSVDRQLDLYYPKQSNFTEDDVYFFGVIQLQPQRARQIVMKNPPSNQFWSLPSIEKAAYLYYFRLYGQYTLKSIKQYHNIFNKEFFKYAVDGDSAETSLIKICKHTRDEYDTRPQRSHQQTYDPSLRNLFRDNSFTSVSLSPSFCEQQLDESDTVLNSKMLDDLCYLGDQLHSSAKQTAEFSHEPSQHSTDHHFGIQDYHQPLSVVSQPPELYHNSSPPQQEASKLEENGGGFLNGITKQLVKYVQSGNEMIFPVDNDPNKFGFDESLGRCADEKRVEEFATPPSTEKIATILNSKNHASAISLPTATIQTYHELPSHQLLHPPTEPYDQLHNGAEDPSTESHLEPLPSRSQYHAEHHDHHHRHSLVNQQTELYHNLSPQQEEASLKENGGGFLNGLTKKLSKYIPSLNDMKLPDESDPNKFRFDESLGRWVGEGVEEAPAPPLLPPSAKTATMLGNKNNDAASLSLSNAGNDAAVTSSHVPPRASFRRNAASRYANPFSLATSPSASSTLPLEELIPPVPTTTPQFYM